MYIKRTVEKSILEAAKSFPCIVLYGPRQVGKSTTLDYVFPANFNRVTLDDTEDRELAEKNPKLFLEVNPWPIIIDEIQKVPALLDAIKIKIDEQRKICLKNNEERKLMYVLTGSNRFELQQGISETLAGRCGIIEMSSFTLREKQAMEAHLFTPKIEVLIQRSQQEKSEYLTRTKIFEEIYKGGMPDICTNVSERNIYYKSYVNTYIEKDVRKLIVASNETQFRNFISIVALRTAQELHYDEIAGAVGIDVKTCKRWLSILETSGIIYLLQPYMSNMSNRIIKAPKLYFMDTGLCAYLCKWPDSKMLENCAMSGAFFETYVVSELIKNFFSFNVNPRDYLYYYRDIDQKEIDLLYVDEAGIYPIEIKKGISPKNPTKNFNVLQKYKRQIKTGLVIDCCDKIRPLNEISYSFPVYLLGI
ncbi:MAG: ATP-binding protein [Treponema sp.]|nr:ATP-binding protein [Treponema sp.]